MARVLYLTQVLPYPLNTGAKVRQYYVLRYLCQKHQLTLVSFVRADDRPEYIAHLEGLASVHTVPMSRSRWQDARAVIKGLLTSQPIVIARDEIAAMQAAIERLLANEHFDFIHADQVSMAQYGLLGQGPRRILDLHNAMCLVTQRLADNEPNPIRRLAMRRETKALARYEAGLCACFDSVVFVTDQDRQAIESKILDSRFKISNNGFSTIPICVDPADKPPIAPVANPYRVTAVGLMFWPPNAEGVVWFAREVWPQIYARFPQARFTVVGKNPPPQISRLHGQGGIEVMGYVQDLGRILAETAVFIVPLHAGGGMRVKILDAWCWGLPIVSTSIGAEGIALRAGENILLADSAEAFAQATARLLSEPGLNQSLRQNGRRWVEEKYDWRRVYSAWDKIYAMVQGE